MLESIKTDKTMLVSAVIAVLVVVITIFTIAFSRLHSVQAATNAPTRDEQVKALDEWNMQLNDWQRQEDARKAAELQAKMNQMNAQGMTSSNGSALK